MRSPRKSEDLSAEPSLREILADPIVQALMARDGVSEDELVQVSLAARMRLARTHEAVVMPFPGALRADTAHPADAGSASHPGRAEPERRPRTRWPFHVRPAGLKQAD